jgi:hypothetical protein
MVEQQSDAWLDLRRCRITASRMADVMAGKDTKRYTQYRQEKVLELLGHKSVEITPEWAVAGKENEPRALAGYEYRYKVSIEHNVFLISTKYDWLGCSPDFLLLPDYNEGGEMKIRKLYKNFRKFKRDAEYYKGQQRCIPACDRHQVQGAMWLTGFKFWWYVNYYIGDDLEGGEVQKIHRIAVPRNQELIDAMEVRCLEFMKDVYERADIAA